MLRFSFSFRHQVEAEHPKPFSYPQEGRPITPSNEIARTLISMMARSTKGSNQRPDTLVQDRTCANSTTPLATHGRTIHRVNRVAGDPASRSADFRSTRESCRHERLVAYFSIPITLLASRPHFSFSVW